MVYTIDMSDWTQAQFSSDLSDATLEEIKSLYISEIAIPHNKPLTQFILCPVGLVGAGKSTVTIPLANKLNLVRISHDEIRKILKEKGFNYDRSKEIAFLIISEFVKKGYSIAIDANCGAPESFEQIKKFSEKYNIRTIWIHINPPEEFILNKLTNYNHTWLFADGEEAVNGYFKYKNKYGDGTRLGIDFTCVFDTSKGDIQEQIEKGYQTILQKISE